MRPDGTRVKVEDPMYHLIPHFMPHRYDSMNMITLDIPEKPLRTYMNRKRKEGRPISHMALLITAYLRAVEQYPALNRFIINRRVYQRNEICVSMAVLKAGGEDTMDKIRLTPGDTIFTVQDKIDSFTQQNRQTGEANSLDKTMNLFVNKLPHLTGLALRILWAADRVGLMPKSLIDISPFHASLLISNLASIRTNHIHHHIYDFGTTSISITMGNLREVPRRTKDGIVFDRCIPLGVVTDDRIANGYYMARAFALIKKLLQNPELMETPTLPQAETETDEAEKSE